MIRALAVLLIFLASIHMAAAILFSTQGPAPALGYLLLHQGGHITLHSGGSLQCHTC